MESDRRIMRGFFLLTVSFLLVTATLAQEASDIESFTGATNVQTSWTQIFQNNLNISDDGNHIGALLTGDLSYGDGGKACTDANEVPLTKAALIAHESDFLYAFNYLCFTKSLSCPQNLRIQDDEVIATLNASSLTFSGSQSQSGNLPQLCTQSDEKNMGYNSLPTAQNQIALKASKNNNTYIGYRNQKSFRFLGVRYAPEPERFTQSKVDTSQAKTTNNTEYAPACVQAITNVTSEDCLFLNIETPHVPAFNGPFTNLKPVLFYVHSGAMIVGSGNSWVTDGGALASREDLVVVTINYRLGTYGLFAAPNSTYTGDYGIGDIVTALRWTKDNIEAFGGNASSVSIVGDSAGAAFVRVLIGSSQAQGLFHSAISMSNLGGGVDLGEEGDYGTSNTFYYTIQESFDKAGSSILKSTGCDKGDNITSQVECLAKTTVSLADLPDQAQWVVQDGNFVTSPYLEVGKPSSIPNPVPLIAGTMTNDGASFILNSQCSAEIDCLAVNLGISKSASQNIINSGLFPLPNTGNVAADAFNVSQRVRTDDTFRCVDQATAYGAAVAKSVSRVYYYNNNRGNGGLNPAGVPDGSAGNGPDTPYYRLHSADLVYAFGNLVNAHGSSDLGATRLLSSLWAAFVRTGDPNPDKEMLQLRGYTDTLQLVTEMKSWDPVSGQDGPMLFFDNPPSILDHFLEVEQCNWLNYSLDYFLNDH